MNNHRSRTRSSIWTMALHASGLGLAFISTILLTRLMTPGDYGQFRVALTIFSLLSLISLIGLDHAAVRFVAEYFVNNSPALLWAFERWVSKTAVLCGVASATIALLITWLITPDWLVNSGLVLLFLGIPAFAITKVCRGRLIALGHSVKGQLAEQILRPIVLIVGTLILWILTDEPLSPFRIAAIILIALAIMAIWQITICQPHRTSIDAPTKPKQWLGVALPLMVASSTIMLMNRTDLLLIAALTDDQAVGTYAIAILVTSVLRLPMKATQQAFSPELVTGYQDDRVANLASITRRISAIAGLTSLALYGCLMLALPILLPVFGPTYTAATPAVWILGAMIVTAAFLGPSGKVLGLNGRHKIMAVLQSMGALANIVLGLILIPMWGIAGAALGTACSMLLWKVTAAIIIWFRFGFLMPFSGTIRDWSERPTT